jgi:hypothetical protein
VHYVTNHGAVALDELQIDVAALRTHEDCERPQSGLGLCLLFDRQHVVVASIPGNFILPPANLQIPPVEASFVINFARGNRNLKQAQRKFL